MEEMTEDLADVTDLSADPSCRSLTTTNSKELRQMECDTECDETIEEETKGNP